MKDDVCILTFLISFSCLLGQAYTYGGSKDTGCETNRDCDPRLAKCFTGFGSDDAMCGCINGLSNYPSCESEIRNNRTGQCAEDCERYNGYCSADGECVCRSGGMWPDTCCRSTCAIGLTCYKGRCECMYGKLPNGACSKCEEDCEPLGYCTDAGSNSRCRCKYRGRWPNCKEDEVDCTEQCGQRSTCRKDPRSSNTIICTSCGPGRRLYKNRRCPFVMEWQQWSSCSVTCGRGTRTRERKCIGQPCIGSKIREETEDCFQKECFGGWEPWQDWQRCSSTCGIGIQKRYRECLNSNGCGSGSAEDIQECHIRACTSERYGEWESWSSCSRCGRGLSTRKRNCLSDIACREKLDEHRECPDCTTWNQWSTCSRTCGPGTKTRTRSCPREGGCGSERTEESTNCEITQCHGIVGEWTNWSECAQCNTGVQTRTRVCTSEPSAPCKQELSDSRTCVGQPCLQDCSKSHTSAQISIAQTLRWEWKNPDTKHNRFQFTCTNGCIRVEQATVSCTGVGANLGHNVLQYVTSQCGAKSTCRFNPNPSTFSIGSCPGFQVAISVKCVAGTAMANHRQAEQKLTGGDIIYDNVRYRCIKKPSDWSWAKKECSQQGRNWGLTMPRSFYVLERLRDLCGLRKIPRPTSHDWFHDAANRGWEHYTYWIGGKSGGWGGYKYLDGTRISKSLYYPGEPSKPVFFLSQNCIQANGKIDNDFCSARRIFVCEMRMRGSDK